MNLRDLLPDYCSDPDTFTGQASLRGLQTEFDPRATCRLPGDEVEDHVCWEPSSSYLRMSPSQLRALLRSGDMPIEEERKVRKALQLLQLQHSDLTCEGGGYNPPH